MPMAFYNSDKVLCRLFLFDVAVQLANLARHEGPVEVRALAGRPVGDAFHDLGLPGDNRFLPQQKLPVCLGLQHRGYGISYPPFECLLFPLGDVALADLVVPV